MKVDRTKFTAQYENGAIRSMWVTVEVSLDSGMGESPHAALDLSKQISDEWYKKQSGGVFEYVPPASTIPTINISQENHIEPSTAELILSAPTIPELESFRWHITNKPDLERAYILRYKQLQGSYESLDDNK